MNKPQNQLRLSKTRALVVGLCLSAGLSQAQTGTGTGTVVRVSSFEYNADGMLSREVIEPDSPQYCLQTTHSYSPQGNPNGTSTSACAGASGHTLSSAGTRSSSKEYLAQSVMVGGVSYTSPAGVFATRTTNALGQSESYQPDHARLSGRALCPGHCLRVR